MAYLRQLKTSPFYIACWSGLNGVKRNRSTKIRVVPVKSGRVKAESAAQARARAQLVADAFEAAETGGDAGKVLATIELLSEHKAVVVPALGAYLTSWLEPRRELYPNTIGTDARAVDKLLAFVGDESLPLDRFTHAQAQLFVTSELARVSLGTVDRYRQSLSVAWNAAIRDGVLSSNPWRGLSFPKAAKQDKVQRQAFSMEDVRVLLSSLPAEWASMVRVSLYTGGQRLSDCAMLRWSDVDFARASVAIVTQKTGRVMAIPMIPSLDAHLRSLRELNPDDEFVHQDLAERVLRYGNTSHISTEFANWVELLGLSSREKSRVGERKSFRTKTFHSLRSMAVTMLHQAGVPLSMAMLIVGHNNAEIHRVYFRPSDEEIRKTMSSLNVDDLG